MKEIKCGFCRDCRHWVKRPWLGPSPFGDMGDCAAIVQHWDATEWNEDGERVIIDGVDALAFAWDGSDYRAGLATKPDFGCVQFKARGETNEVE